MSAVMAAVPYGLTTTLTYPLTGGGPVTMIWGWVALEHDHRVRRRIAGRDDERVSHG